MSIDHLEFKNPSKRFQPLVRWWWTGLDVKKDELLKELEFLDRMGFGGAEIQCFMIGMPFHISKSWLTRCHRFMQPYYYEMIKYVLDEARKRGMLIDLTVCSSWPAGGTHVTKAQSLKTLLIGTKIVKGKMDYNGPVPKFKKPIYYTISKFLKRLIKLEPATFYKKDFNLIAVIAAKTLNKPGKIKLLRNITTKIDITSIIDLTDKIDRKGNLSWKIPAGKWQIFSIFAGPSGTRPLLDARSSPDKKSLVLDHYSSLPIVEHLEKHLDAGKSYFEGHFGSTLRAFFTDSLELTSELPWTDDFLEEFKRRRGYDIRPFLPVFFVRNKYNKYLWVTNHLGSPYFDFNGDIGNRIRYDFDKTLSDLFCERFVKIMTEWAAKNKLKSRIQAYGIIADTLKAYGLSDIPETEQLYAGGVLDFLRFAASASALYGKSITSAEAFVWNQREYLTTPLKWKVAADRLFVSGINQIIHHGFPYLNPNKFFDYPGQGTFSNKNLPPFTRFSSNFSRHNPFREFFPIMTTYLSRCQYILQQGQPVMKIGIFFPLFNYPDSVLKNEELVGGVLDNFDATRPKNQMGGALKNRKYWDDDDKWLTRHLKLTDILVANGYAYVHINEDSLLNGIVENSKLIVGHCEIRALIFNHIEKISVELLEKLVELQNSNIKLIFIGNLPDKQPGYFDHENGDEKVKKIFSEDLKGNIIHLNNIDKTPKALLMQAKLVPEISYEKPQKSIQFLHKTTGNSEIYFIRHSENYKHALKAKFPFKNMVPYILNPFTGFAEQAPQFQFEDDGVSIDLYLEAYGSIFLELEQAEEKFHVRSSSIKLYRDKEEIYGLIDKPGSYKFELPDGSEKIIEIYEKDLLPIVPISRWNLQLTKRLKNGKERKINMKLDEPKDWRAIPKLKFCSATGIYTSRFRLDYEYLKQNVKLFLRTGRVSDAANIVINGKEIGPVLIPPYEIEITNHVRLNENLIQIRVIPTLRNRIVGYSRVKRKRRLAPAGLLEPVRVIPRLIVKLK
ncbi:MAG: glycosyl hydrolase [Promethearchaeota archaeon]